MFCIIFAERNRVIFHKLRFNGEMLRFLFVIVRGSKDKLKKKTVRSMCLIWRAVFRSLSLNCLSVNHTHGMETNLRYCIIHNASMTSFVPFQYSLNSCLFSNWPLNLCILLLKPYTTMHMSTAALIKQQKNANA